MGNFDLGVLEGVAAIISKTDPEFNSDDLSSITRAAAQKGARGKPGLFDIFILIFVVFGFFAVVALSLLSRFSGGSLSRHGHYHSYGAGRRGGGFGGGGGFSGGGGGFSGGGASGGW